MSTEQRRLASGGTTEQSPQTSDTTDMDNLSPEEMIASINADSRRTMLRNAIFVLSCTALALFFSYLYHTHIITIELIMNHKGVAGIGLMFTVLLAIALVMMVYHLLGIPTPMGQLPFFPPHRTNSTGEFSLPQFPYTLEELKKHRPSSHTFSKVLLYPSPKIVHKKLVGPTAYELVVFDTSGQMYDFLQGTLKQNLEEQGQELASLLDVPFERSDEMG